MSKSANRPSHVVYAVTKTGERNFWNAIGAAWVHARRRGLQREARLPPAQRRGDRHSQAQGR